MGAASLPYLMSYRFNLSHCLSMPKPASFSARSECMLPHRHSARVGLLCPVERCCGPLHKRRRISIKIGCSFWSSSAAVMMSELGALRGGSPQPRWTARFCPPRCQAPPPPPSFRSRSGVLGQSPLDPCRCACSADGATARRPGCAGRCPQGLAGLCGQRPACIIDRLCKYHGRGPAGTHHRPGAAAIVR
jgi:hypothetical protein